MTRRASCPSPRLFPRKGEEARSSATALSPQLDALRRLPDSFGPNDRPFRGCRGAPSAALRRRAQGPAVDDGGLRLLVPACGETQDDAQVPSQSLDASRTQPSLRLLIDDLPGRKIVRHPTPRRAGLHDIAQAVEHLAQRMDALRALFGQKRQIRRDKRPLLVGNIRRIRIAG